MQGGKHGRRGWVLRAENAQDAVDDAGGHAVTQHPDVVSLVESLGEKSGTDTISDALSLIDLAEDLGVPQQE